ncbi:MAG: hypothetical protein EWM72_00827 [Nitrospira sp.]|nr:MAG: hypothetical protein EWM72_00827 [Nitrospira sp.]
MFFTAEPVVTPLWIDRPAGIPLPLGARSAFRLPPSPFHWSLSTTLSRTIRGILLRIRRVSSAQPGVTSAC